jgi:hypothetical protein
LDNCWSQKMNTRILAISIALAAVTVVLNPRFSGIAIPFVPPLWFQIWEIPVVAALFLVGFKPAVGIALLNALILQAVSPGVSFNQPIANLVAILSTLIAVYLAHRLITRKTLEEVSFPERKLIISSTTLGIVLRLAIMLPYTYIQATLLVQSNMLAIFPLVGVYDAIVVLYTVPLGYLVAKMVNKNLKLPTKYAL